MAARYEQDLVEGAVTLHLAAGRAPSLQALRFHHERERLYRILDADDRNEAFFQLHLDWFREWGMEEMLVAPTREWRLLTGALHLLAFRSAKTQREEGAELYVNEAGQRHAVVALRVERFRHAARLTAFLNHELLHLNDMVDPAFGYAPEIRGRFTPAQQRLARERYRLLWDVTIDGRLIRGGKTTVAAEEQRRAEFDLVFPFWPEAKRAEVFEALWNNDTPTHATLESHVRDPRELQTASGPIPGAPCPLCNFPTFDWAPAPQLTDAVGEAIRVEFPHWCVTQGACSRCADIYRMTISRRELDRVA